MIAPAPRIVVLRNPAASGHPERSLLPPGIPVVTPSGLRDLDGQLGEIAGAGCDLLVIDGGDGTVRETLSRLFETFDPLPVVGILAHGNTNLIARHRGCLTDPARLGDLRLADLKARSRPSPVLRIDRPGAPPLRGFIAGWGAYAAGTRIAVSEIGSRGSGQVWRTVLATLRRSLFGAEARALRRGVEAQLAADGRALSPGRRFLGLATVLEMPLMAGIAPIWGTGPGNLGWLDVTAPPRRLWLGAPLALTGRPMRWMAPAGYRSGRCDSLDLEVCGGVVLDGDPVAAAAGVPLSLTARETVRILTL